MLRRAVSAAVFLGAVAFAHLLPAAGLLVAFRGGADGGLLKIDVDEHGRIAGVPEPLFRRPGFAAAKLRVAADGRRATLNAESAERENFAIVDLSSASPRAPRFATLDFAPEEHRLAGGFAWVAGADGNLVALDLDTGEVTRRWSSRRDLSPPGHKPEDLLALEPEGLLLVSHQKDGKNGRLGGRVAVLRLADFSQVGDLRLPRDHPELHLSGREAGPSPEVIRADRATNTLLLTLDLYGALAFADLDAALAGRLAHYEALPTSADGAWGKSFPDRLAIVRTGGRVLAVVSNAAADGGLAVFDVASRRRVAFFPVEAGCAEPVLVGDGRTMATVVSGKRKRIVGDVIRKTDAPGRDLLLLDLGRVAAGAADALARAPLGGPAGQVATVPGRPGFVAVTILEPARLLLCSAADGRVISSVDLPGRPVALEPLP